MKDKRFVLFLFSLTVMSLVMLGSGLNNVTLRRSQLEFKRIEETQVSEKSMGGLTEIIIPQSLIVAAAILLIGLFAAIMISPNARNHFLNESMWRAAAYVVIFSMIFLWTKATAALSEIFAGYFEVKNIITAPPVEGDVASLTFTPSEPSDLFLFLIMLVIALVFSITVWRSYHWWQEQADQVNPLDEIANMARVSLRELSLQAPARDAIINCYENMSQAVSKRRGLDRKVTMTAGEFAQKLRNAGLPDKPVNHLTHLFESARYSPHPSTQKDIDEAVACLTSILQYCGEKK